jgi:hypothetical protein
MSIIVQSLWIGTDLPTLQRLSIRSFLEQGHVYHLYAYEEVGQVPEGTTICDASTILPQESIFCYQEGFGRGSYSAFSNLFRYRLLFEKGGWWVDTDVVCLRPFDFEDDFVFATEHKHDCRDTAASCVIKSPARSEYLRYCLDVCEAKDKAKIIWGEIGPDLMDEAINGFNLTSHRVPAYVFNPIDYFDFADILKPDFDMSRLSDSHAVHLWNQKWKSHYLDPDDDGPPDSLYALLRKRYLSSTTWDLDPLTRLKRKVEFQRKCMEDLRRERDECQLALGKAKQETVELKNSLTDAQQEIAGLKNSLTDARKEISGLRNSMSWKITGPLRTAYDMLAKSGLESSRRGRRRSR